jgi:hypothetical protein
MDPILEYALEHKNYFEWPMEIKSEACQRLAAWITNLSFSTSASRSEIIVKLLNDAEFEGEFEYCAFVKDVETFFLTSNWDHLKNNHVTIDSPANN